MINKEWFNNAGYDIEFIPFGNNPENAIDGVVFSIEDYQKIKKALFEKSEQEGE